MPAPPPKKKKTGKGGTKTAPPPVRSRMIVIDPRRYERTHLGAGMLDAEEVNQERGWICVDSEEGEKGVVRWVREGPNGEELGSEEVLVGKKRVDEVLKVLSRLREQETGKKTVTKDVEMADADKSDDEEEFQPLDFDNDASDDGEDDWVSLHPTGHAATGSPTLFADIDLPASTNGPPSPLFTSKKLPSVPAATTSKSVPTPAPVASKPTPAAKAAPKPTPATVKPAPKAAPAPKTAAPAEVDPLERAFLEEKSRGLDVLKGLFEGGWSPEPMSPPAGVEALPGGIIYNSDSEPDEIPKTRQPVKLFEEVEEVAVPVAVVKKAAPKQHETVIVVAPKPVAEAVAEKKSVSFVGVPEVEEAVAEVVDEGYEEDDEGIEEDASEDEAELDPIELAMRELRGWGGSESEGEEEETAVVEDASNVIRPRGGAGSDASSSSSSSSDEDSSSEDEEDSSSSSSSSDDDEDVPMADPAPVVPEPTPTATTATSPPPPSSKPLKKPNALRDLFAPQASSTSSGGLFGDFSSSSSDTPFSLLSSLPLDLDLDPASDPTLSASLPIPAPLPASHTSAARASQPEMASSGTTMTATFKPDPSVPYFFPFLHLSQAERAKGPKLQAKSVMELEREKVSEMGESGMGRVTGGFWRTQTEEEMQARWETDHLELTREYKKRHREAVKRRRRRGAVDGEEDGEGNAAGDN